MSNVVYVINQNGNPLMPCKPSKARKLLRDGRARVERRGRLWYRPARFQNRASSRRSGRLPVSIKTNVEDCQLLERGQTILWKNVA